VEWRKGPEPLQYRDIVSPGQNGAACELETRDLGGVDSAVCVWAGGHLGHTGVQGEDCMWPRS